MGSIRRDRTKVVDKSLKVVGFMYAEIGFVSLAEHTEPGFDLAALLPPMRTEAPGS